MHNEMYTREAYREEVKHQVVAEERGRYPDDEMKLSEAAKQGMINR